MASYVRALTGDCQLILCVVWNLSLVDDRATLSSRRGGTPTCPGEPCPVGLPLTKHASVSYSLLPIDQRARLTKYLARVHRARC